MWHIEVKHRFSFIQVKWRGGNIDYWKKKWKECTPYCCKNGVLYSFCLLDLLHKSLVNDLELYIGKYIHGLSKVDFQIGKEGWNVELLIIAIKNFTRRVFKERPSVLRLKHWQKDRRILPQIRERNLNVIIY